MRAERSKARQHCERAFPNEGVCAIVQNRFWPLLNVAAEPTRSFEIDARGWMALERAAGDHPVWLFHSHVDAPATLSARDEAAFTIDGRPLLPHLRLVVLSVREGRCVDEACFTFESGRWVPNITF